MVAIPLHRDIGAEHSRDRRAKRLGALDRSADHGRASPAQPGPPVVPLPPRLFRTCPRAPEHVFFALEVHARRGDHVVPEANAVNVRYQDLEIVEAPFAQRFELRLLDRDKVTAHRRA